MSKWGKIPPELSEAAGVAGLGTLGSREARHRVVVGIDQHGVLKLVDTLAEVATNTWKATQRLSRVRMTIPEADGDRLARHLEAIEDCLSKAEFEVKDHTGKPFDYGQSLKVVASQPKNGIEREAVAETIRPTIYWKGVLVQQGEVIIDVPVTKDGL